MADPHEALERDRRTTTARLVDLRGDFEAMVAASRDTNADDEHDSEGATIAFERAQLDALIRRAEAHLADVSAALQRLEAGSYGTCVRCGRRIDPARLEARPTADRCLACAGAT